jgi:hypothetical protein
MTDTPAAEGPELHHVTFTVAIPGTLAHALDRRDEITALMSAIGVRISLTDGGTDVRLVDHGLPTIGDALSEPGTRSTARLAARSARLTDDTPPL